jgi:hypothetical protein
LSGVPALGYILQAVGEPPLAGLFVDFRGKAMTPTNNASAELNRICDRIVETKVSEQLLVEELLCFTGDEPASYRGDFLRRMLEKDDKELKLYYQLAQVCKRCGLSDKNSPTFAERLPSLLKEISAHRQLVAQFRRRALDGPERKPPIEWKKELPEFQALARDYLCDLQVGIEECTGWPVVPTSRRPGRPKGAPETADARASLINDWKLSDVTKDEFCKLRSARPEAELKKLNAALQYQRDQKKKRKPNELSPENNVNSP